MGSNQSKLCSGDPEREYRRAELERKQEGYRQRQASSDTAQGTVHIHCHEDEVDHYMERTNAAAIMFHFKVVKSPVIRSENALEGGELQSLAKTSGAEEMASAVLAEATITEPGDVVVRPEAGEGDIVVRSEPSGDLLVGTDAQPTALDLPLARFCDKVVRVLHVTEKPFGDCLERTKAQPTVEDRSPSSAEPQLPTAGSDYQMTNPSRAEPESWRAGDVHCPNEEAFLVNDQKAPCEMTLELATKDALGTAEEPTPGQTQLDKASSEETLEAPEAAPYLASTETSNECSDSKASLGAMELAELLLNLGTDLPPAVSEPRWGLKGTEEKVPEGYSDVETQLEGLRVRDQHEVTAVVNSDHETEWPTASITFHNSGLQLESPEAARASCKKINVADLLLAGDGTNCDTLQKHGAICTPEAMKLGVHQTSVVQNTESQPPIDVAEVTAAPSSPKALLESAEAGQVGPMKEPQEACPIEATDQLSKTQANHLSVQLPLETTPILGAALEQGASRQRC